jgi:hypothetical protein
MRLPKWATALDVVAVVAMLLVVPVAAFDGFRWDVFGLRISVTEWWRPLLVAAVAIAIRHAIVRRDPLPRLLAARVRGWWGHPDTRVVLPIHLGSRLAVLLIGFLAINAVGFPAKAVGAPDQLPGNRWQVYRNDLLDLPARFDAGWYIGIANGGYAWDPEAAPSVHQNIAFFPAFPFAIRLVAPLLGRHVLWAGVVVSLVAFYFALIYLIRLARRELGDGDQAATAVVLLAAYPFAIFYSAVYTEALFLLTLVGAVYHYREQQWWRSAFWGFLCGLTRPNGALLSIVLGLMAVAPMWDAARRRVLVPPPPGWGAIAKRLLAAAAPGFGMLAFSAYIWSLTGNPFQWTKQNAAWGRDLNSPFTVLVDRYEYIAFNGWYTYISTQTDDLMQALAVVFVLAALWPVYRRFGLPYAVLILVIVIPPLSAGGLLSMGRVTSILFPVFLWLGAALPATHRPAWIAVFACLQGFVAVLFFTWRPLF